jgi:hypothetical protein
MEQRRACLLKQDNAFRCLRSPRCCYGPAELDRTEAEPTQIAVGSSLMDMPVCEIWIDDAWRPVRRDQALTTYADALKRCPACHGKLLITGSARNSEKLTLSHRPAHDGCPLDPMRYSGIPSPHPKALV